MSLSTGARLGAYEIVAPLGAGGMGEVYRATDTKLGRQVAIKVLPSALANDARYMARLEREAQLLAALNHPNIAAIYGVEGGALIMELVEGQTLAERIRVGPVPVEEVLPIARQIAEGLEAAHDRGIVHRDLKPANIKITPEGVVKLLDFGLAKAAEEPGTTAGSNSMSPTISLAMTQAGMILGTAAYMSPEQARGKPVDRRADIWAFGVVLYEMLTGSALFGGGETITDTLASVVKEAPDWDALPRDTPAHIRRLLERCLRKDPKSRLRDMGDARIFIDEPIEGAAVPHHRLSWLPWAIAGALAIGLAVTAIAWRPRQPALKPLMRLSVELGGDATLARTGGGSTLALSPDGTRLVVAYRGPDGKARLGTRLLHQNQITPLSGTENGNDPFFSPDGRWIGFFADRKLKKIAVEGGATVTLCEAPIGRGGSWGDDGNIIAALSTVAGLSRVSSAGGTPALLTKLSQGERTHRWPQVLPGKGAVLFTAHTGGGNYDDANIDVVSLKTGERKTVQRGGFSGRYLPSGHVVYVHENTLFAVRFDADRLAVVGSPVPVLEDMNRVGGPGGDFATSQTGTFVYVTGTGGGGAGASFFWLDGAGKTQPLHAATGFNSDPRLSPDGKRLAFAVRSGEEDTIWVKDLERDTPSRLSFLPGRNRRPVWTPDGRFIVFHSQNPGKPGFYWIRSDGSGEAQRLTEDQFPAYPASFSPDGKRLAMVRGGADSSADIVTAAVEGDPAHPRLGKPETFVGTRFNEVEPAFSPDGRWLAYQSSESGNNEVYVRPFPGPGGRWQISTGGGFHPRWSRDGRELFFLGPDWRIMVTPYTARGDSFSADKPRVWSEVRPVRLGRSSSYDVAPDGKRVAVLLAGAESGEQKPMTHVTFLLNFFDELRRRIAAGDL